jgi:hypothetical protein
MFPVDFFQNTLTKLVAILHQLSVRFHLTGGVTSVLYGEPRMTQDLDVVVDNPTLTAQLDAFLLLLRETDFLFDDVAVRHALNQQGMFQLFDSIEALKLDVYPRELIPGELDRSILVEIFPGVRLPVASRVDTAAAKLIWISKGSHKSRRDLRQLFRTSSPTDRQQIQKLASQLDLANLLADVLVESDEIS